MGKRSHKIPFLLKSFSLRRYILNPSSTRECAETNLDSHSCSSLNSLSTSFHQSAAHQPTNTCINETLRGNRKLEFLNFFTVKHLHHSGRKACQYDGQDSGYWNFKCSILNLSNDLTFNSNFGLTTFTFDDKKT